MASNSNQREEERDLSFRETENLEAGGDTQAKLLVCATGFHTAVNRTSNPASTYRYSPLPANSIRLLRLQPNSDENAPIQCQLFDYPFVGSRKGTHLYEALSYVWGSEDKPRCVSTNEGDLYITENLHDALLRLRDCSLPRIIWADAICINQDDDEERGRQVEMMAEIYARASRVVVWLEEATNIRSVGNGTSDGIHRAFEAISSAASSQSVRFSDDKATRLAIHSLFQRSWFSRIWVLQEVAAARHVIIMCHLMDIDGYAFCEGLNALNLALEDPETQNLIRSAVYLIKTAVLRPKHASARADRFSLNTRPLGELMDMYHNRKAKDWRDKVYALLGMSSDVIVGLSPNYGIPWSDLFHQLIHSIIREQASVRTWDNRQIAVIKSLGYVLGIVSSVSSTRAWDDKQNITLDFFLRNDFHELWKSDCIWTLQASANPIQQGDVVCLLQGASKPTIVRLNEDYCTIIAISVTPGGVDQPKEITFNWQDELSQAGFPGPSIRPNGQPKEMPATWQEYIQKKKSLPRQFLLIWDWEMPCEGLRGIDYERVLKNRVIEHTETEDHWSKATRLHNIGLLLNDSEKCEEAIEKHIKVIEVDKKTYEPNYLQLLPLCSDMTRVVAAYREPGTGWLRAMADALGQRGDCTKVIERGVVLIARLGRTVGMGQILQRHGDQILITEEVVKAAAADKFNGKDKIRLLLDQVGNEVPITEEVMRVAAENSLSGYEIIELIFDQRKDQIPITEEAIEIAVNYHKEKMVNLFLDRYQDQTSVTEKVMEKAEGRWGKESEIVRKLRLHMTSRRLSSDR